MAKRAKKLEIKHREIYKPENMNCEECGESLHLQNHYQWSKTVQHLTGAVHISSQGGSCVNPDCSNEGEVIVSSESQRFTLPGYTYGLDVIAEIGWLRDQEHLSRREVHLRLLCKGLQLSERQVDYLYSQYQILLGCVGVEDKSRLVEISENNGGLKLSLDGLSPEGGSEQLWVVREVESGIILVVGWLERVNHETLKMLLEPVEGLGLPIVATVSDKQSSVRKALEEMWPDMPHQWCQPHYLGNLADPLYEQDRSLKTEMRQTIREEVRESLNEVLEDGEGSAVDFVAGAAVTGKFTSPQNPSSEAELSDDDTSPPQSNMPESSMEEVTPAGEGESSSCSLDTTLLDEPKAKTIEDIVRDFALDLKEALSRQGRAPFVLAGLAMMEDLTALLNTILDCLNIYEEPHLRHWANILSSMLEQYAQPFDEVRTAQQWVGYISYILQASSITPSSKESFLPEHITLGHFVEARIQAFIKRLLSYKDLSPWLQTFRDKIIKITRSYQSGLFHCYDIQGLPSSNNALEGLFARTKRLIRRRLGVNNISNPLLRHGPWALLLTSATSPEELTLLFQDISYELYRTQRSLFEERLQRLLHRFRWRHRRDYTLNQRFLDWIDAVPA